MMAHTLVLATIFALLLLVSPLIAYAEEICQPDVYEIPTSDVMRVHQWDWEILQADYTYNVPQVLIRRVMWVESRGYQFATSPAGARGLMQVMPFWFNRGESYYDPLTNIKKGAYVLRTNYNRYGTWTKAAMAYFGLYGSDYWGTTASSYVRLIFRTINGC